MNEFLASSSESVTFLIGYPERLHLLTPMSMSVLPTWRTSGY